jgi:hypothetical protein
MQVLWTHYSLNYMAATFMILELAGSWEAWRTVYFWPHILMLVGNTAGTEDQIVSGRCDARPERYLFVKNGHRSSC